MPIKNINDRANEKKKILNNFTSRVPYNRSDNSNIATASQNIEKRIIPAMAKIIVIQNGKNKIENKIATEKQTLNIINLYYTLLPKITN